MTEDRTKMPEGMRTWHYHRGDQRMYMAAVGSAFPLVHAREADAIAAAWRLVDQQRSIGAAQERERQLPSLNYLLTERDARVRREALLTADRLLDSIFRNYETHELEEEIHRMLRELAGEGSGE